MNLKEIKSGLIQSIEENEACYIADINDKNVSDLNSFELCEVNLRTAIKALDEFELDKIHNKDLCNLLQFVLEEIEKI